MKSINRTKKTTKTSSSRAELRISLTHQKISRVRPLGITMKQFLNLESQRKVRVIIILLEINNQLSFLVEDSNIGQPRLQFTKYLLQVMKRMI